MCAKGREAGGVRCANLDGIAQFAPVGFLLWSSRSMFSLCLHVHAWGCCCAGTFPATSGSFDIAYTARLARWAQVVAHAKTYHVAKMQDRRRSCAASVWRATRICLHVQSSDPLRSMSKCSLGRPVYRLGVGLKSMLLWGVVLLSFACAAIGSGAANTATATY